MGLDVALALCQLVPATITFDPRTTAGVHRCIHSSSCTRILQAAAGSLEKAPGAPRGCRPTWAPTTRAGRAARLSPLRAWPRAPDELKAGAPTERGTRTHRPARATSTSRHLTEHLTPFALNGLHRHSYHCRKRYRVPKAATSHQRRICATHDEVASAVASSEAVGPNGALLGAQPLVCQHPRNKYAAHPTVESPIPQCSDWRRSHPREA